MQSRLVVLSGDSEVPPSMKTIVATFNWCAIDRHPPSAVEVDNQYYCLRNKGSKTSVVTFDVEVCAWRDQNRMSIRLNDACVVAFIRGLDVRDLETSGHLINLHPGAGRLQK